MLSEVQYKLEKSWVMGFSNLRVADHSTNDSDIEVYAIDFNGKQDDTITVFMTNLGQMISRLSSKFEIIGACLDFEDTPFAVVEFREKE